MKPTDSQTGLIKPTADSSTALTGAIETYCVVQCVTIGYRYLYILVLWLARVASLGMLLWIMHIYRVCFPYSTIHSTLQIYCSDHSMLIFLFLISIAPLNTTKGRRLNGSSVIIISLMYYQILDDILASSSRTVVFMVRVFHTLICRQPSETNRFGLYTSFLISKTQENQLCMCTTYHKN